MEDRNGDSNYQNNALPKGNTSKLVIRLFAIHRVNKGNRVANGDTKQDTPIGSSKQHEAVSFGALCHFFGRANKDFVERVYN